MKNLLILSLMVLSTGLNVLISQPAYSNSQSTLPTLSQNDDEVCNDSNGDGQCDSHAEEE